MVVLIVIFSPTKACPNPPSEFDDAVIIGIVIQFIGHFTLLQFTSLQFWWWCVVLLQIPRFLSRLIFFYLR